MNNIEIHKLNTKEIILNIEPFEGTIEKILFTVEDNLKNICITKSLENGIQKQEDNSYLISIDNIDSKDMEINVDYEYYLEIIASAPKRIKTVEVGKFIVLDSSTELKKELPIEGE